MAPKKREKEHDKDHAQADHELFLQAFESKFYLYLASSLKICTKFPSCWSVDYLLK